MPDLAVCIVSYNRGEYLVRCLESLQAQDLPLEIVVVDNASADGAPDRVAEHFPNARVIRNAVNEGFSIACNQGIAASEAPFVLLLNNDTEVLPGALRHLVEFAAAHPEAGAVGCKLLTTDGQNHRLPASIFSSLAWFPDRRARVAWVVGAAVLLRRTALTAIGGLDEGFRFYYEDVDLGWRLRKAGWVCYYTPEARIIHHERASTSLVRPWTLVQLYRGRLLLARKHYPLILPILRAWLRLTLPFRLARAKKEGDEGLVSAGGEIAALLR